MVATAIEIAAERLENRKSRMCDTSQTILVRERFSMADEQYRILLKSDDELTSPQGARSLTDELREIPGVLKATRRKEEESTMDLGPIVEVIIKSGAAVAIAGGIADWIRRNRGIHLIITKDHSSSSIKAEIENADPETAKFITEKVVGA
jgi:Effector Associated Constant Component 1